MSRETPLRAAENVAVGIYKSNHTKIRYFVLGKEHGLCWSLVWVVLIFFFLSLRVEGEKD